MTFFKALCLVVLVAGLSIAIFSCSQEDRQDSIERVKNAASALNGDDKSLEKEHETPLIVQEQQKKERRRQNTEWTPENQKLHPIEYCQAMLEYLEKYSKTLDVASYKLITEENKVQRTIEDNTRQINNLQKFLEDAKKKYTEAEASGKWPMELNGFYLSKEKAQVKIVDANKKLQELSSQGKTPNNQLVLIKKKQKMIQDKQKEVLLLKERFQAAINDLNTRKVIEGSNSISDSLNALNDSIGALGGDFNDPDLDSLMTPTTGDNLETEFNAIMGK